MSEYPDIPSFNQDPPTGPGAPSPFDTPVAFESRRPRLINPDHHALARAAPPRICVVETMLNRSGTWEVRGFNEFAGGRSFHNHYQCLREVPTGLGLPPGALVYHTAGAAVDAARTLGSMNRGHLFRAVEIEVNFKFRVLTPERSAEGLEARLERLVEANPNLETGRAIAEALAALREAKGEAERVRLLAEERSAA